MAGIRVQRLVSVGRFLNVCNFTTQQLERRTFTTGIHNVFKKRCLDLHIRISTITIFSTVHNFMSATTSSLDISTPPVR
jgi:hypothetical protein